MQPAIVMGGGSHRNRNWGEGYQVHCEVIIVGHCEGQQASGGPSLARPACPPPLVLVLAIALYLLSPAAP